MRKHLAALVVVAPLLVSCADTPSAPSLGPEAGFALSNPPPPPVSGFGFGFTSLDQSSSGSSLTTVPLATFAPNGDNGQGNLCTTGVGSAGACFAAMLFQNGPGLNAWINFTNDVPKLPHAIAAQFGCSQSPGRIHFTDGETNGQGCAWAFIGEELILIDLEQFDGAGNTFNLVRDGDGNVQCAGIGDQSVGVQALRIGEQGPPVPVTLIFFQFQQPTGEFDDVPCEQEEPSELPTL